MKTPEVFAKLGDMLSATGEWDTGRLRAIASQVNHYAERATVETIRSADTEQDHAAMARAAEKGLRSLLPKPDSEQRRNAGDGKLPQESPEASADSNHGTASGRRNGEAVSPGGGE